jgi:hypothetical protein
MEPTPAKPSSAATVEGSSRVVIFPPAEGREGLVDDARRHPTTNDAARRGGLAVALREEAGVRTQWEVGRHSSHGDGRNNEFGGFWPQ